MQILSETTLQNTQQKEIQHYNNKATSKNTCTGMEFNITQQKWRKCTKLKIKASESEITLQHYANFLRNAVINYRKKERKLRKNA